MDEAGGPNGPEDPTTGDARVFGAARTTRRRWPCTLAAIVGLPVLLVVAPFVSNAFGTGTAAATPAQTSISLRLGRAGTSANTMNVQAAGMRPGDIAERTLDVVLGTKVKARVSLSLRIANSSLLDRRPQDGLQVTILSCPTAWTAPSARHYTCPRGKPRTLLASIPLSRAKQGNPVVLSTSSTSTTFHLRVVLTLPATAGNALQGQVSVLRFDLSALPARAR